MAEPIATDIPHELGTEEAKRRIEAGIGDFANFVPGGVIAERRWDGDRLTFVVAALGQRLDCRLDVEDRVIHTLFTLPPLLAPFAGAIRKGLQKTGPKLLEKK